MVHFINVAPIKLVQNSKHFLSVFIARHTYGSPGVGIKQRYYYFFYPFHVLKPREREAGGDVHSSKTSYDSAIESSTAFYSLIIQFWLASTYPPRKVCRFDLLPQFPEEGFPKLINPGPEDRILQLMANFLLAVVKPSTSMSTWIHMVSRSCFLLHTHLMIQVHGVVHDLPTDPP
jgi:hypothetical protein